MKLLMALNSLGTCDFEMPSLNSGLQDDLGVGAVQEDAIRGADQETPHLEQNVQHLEAHVGIDLTA